ncbi:MAG TPA: hypothetical protein VG184_00640 [Acidimicrobiales bacterium]|nr:hypothetical protein [Acidimicrobiales bacterium]
MTVEGHAGRQASAAPATGRHISGARGSGAGGPWFGGVGPTASPAGRSAPATTASLIEATSRGGEPAPAASGAKDVDTGGSAKLNLSALAGSRSTRTRTRPSPASAVPLPVFEGIQPLVPLAPPGWTITSERLRWDGLDRYYLVARPVASSQPVAPGGRSGATLPVLVVLHGRMMTPASAERVTGFLSEVGRAIVVYPAGYDESWNAGYCCGGASRAQMNDLGFIESVVHKVVNTEPGASPHGVYLVGYSNGGRMAYRLACSDPGAFAGVAAVEAVPVAPCDSTTPVPLIEVASTADPLLTVNAGAPPKYMAGRAEVTVQVLTEQWRHRDGCTAAASASTRGALVATVWSHCAAGSRIELALYRGGSHAWPRGSAATPSAQEVIWSFFHG